MTWRRRRLPALGLLAASAVSVLPGGAGADEDFVAGSGRARASIFEVVPRTGGLTLPISFGRATASFLGTDADATSVALRVPEGGSEVVADCGDRGPGGRPGGRKPVGGGGADLGTPGAPSPNRNPFISSITVTSDDEDSEGGRRASSLASPPGGAFSAAASEQAVFATDDPSARSTTVEGRFEVAEMIRYTQARAEAFSGVVEGRTRESSAAVAIGRLDLLGGTVVLEQLRWAAIQRTGEDPQADGSFTVGRIAIGDTPVPVPTGADADPFAALNATLAPTGLAFLPPRVEQDEERGVVRVSPLSVRLSDSPLGRSAVGPVARAVQPARDPLVDVLLSLSCDLGPAVLVADVVTSIVAGSGGVSFDVGGVSASTEGRRYDNPFGGPVGGGFGMAQPPPVADPPLPPPASDLVAAPALAGLPPAFSAGAPIPALPGTTVAGDEPPPPPTIIMAQPATGPAPGRLAGTRGGAALAVGIIGLVAVLAVAGADALHLRRAARTIS